MLEKMNTSQECGSVSTFQELAFINFLQKKKKDGTCEWVHFIQRDNGTKEKFYTGETKNSEELKLVLEVMNGVLAKTFGKETQMGEGNPNIYSTDGIKAIKEIN